MIHSLVGKLFCLMVLLFVTPHCISASSLIHQRNLFRTDAAVVLTFTFTYEPVCSHSPIMFTPAFKSCFHFVYNKPLQKKFLHNVAEMLTLSTQTINVSKPTQNVKTKQRSFHTDAIECDQLKSAIELQAEKRFGKKYLLNLSTSLKRVENFRWFQMQ